MALTHAFQEAVSDGNVRKIRIMLKDSLLVDPSFARFGEMEKAAASVEGLYDEHDGRDFIENPDEWDDSYMDKIMVQVVGNFSHERIAHLKAVVRKLRPAAEHPYQEVKRQPRNLTAGSYQEQKRRDQLSGDYKYAVMGAGAGAIAGGATGYAAGTAAALPAGYIAGCAIGGAVIGAAVGGGLVYFISGNR